MQLNSNSSTAKPQLSPRPPNPASTQVNISNNNSSSSSSNSSGVGGFGGAKLFKRNNSDYHPPPPILNNAYANDGSNMGGGGKYFVYIDAYIRHCLYEMFGLIVYVCNW